MSLLIPVLDSGSAMVERRMSIPLALNVTAELRAQSPPIAAEVMSGEGTMVFIDVISEILDAAR